ncbi:MAG TPA: hypothetical protein VF331_24710 [Polyangiales bacterium]
MASAFGNQTAASRDVDRPVNVSDGSAAADVGTARAAHRHDRLLGDAEQRVLLAVLDVRGDRPIPWTDALDWPALIRTARRGQILPTLAQRAFAQGVTIADTRARDELRDCLHETAVYNTRLLAELARSVAPKRSAASCTPARGSQRSTCRSDSSSSIYWRAWSIAHAHSTLPWAAES